MAKGKSLGSVPPEDPMFGKIHYHDPVPAKRVAPPPEENVGFLTPEMMKMGHRAQELIVSGMPAEQAFLQSLIELGILDPERLEENQDTDA